MRATGTWFSHRGAGPEKWHWRRSSDKGTSVCGMFYTRRGVTATLPPDDPRHPLCVKCLQGWQETVRERNIEAGLRHQLARVAELLAIKCN